MDRVQRRGITRIDKRHITTGERKHSHRLAPQRCVLWVPARAGYVRDFCRKAFEVVDSAEAARHFDEDDAARAALSFREVAGMHVAVRPVHNTQAGAA